MDAESSSDDVGGGCVVCLVPSRTDTRWWHDNVMRYASGIRLIKGRLKFGGSKSAAPFPSAVVIFDGRPKMWNSVR